MYTYVTDMEFLINNTTQMTFNRVYWTPRAMASASWELALKSSISNYNSITQLQFIALKQMLYNNCPIHNNYFRPGNTRLPRSSSLVRGNTHFPRTWCLARGKHPHSAHLSLARGQHPRRPQGFVASQSAGLAWGNSLHDSRCLPCGLRTD